MKFDGLYKHIIESLNDLKYGGREVYICNIYIEEYYNTKKLDSIEITPIDRMPEDDFEYWDEQFVDGFDTFEEALESLATEYLMSTNVEHGGEFDVGHEYYFEPQAVEIIKNKLRKLFKPYLHLPGEWKYSSANDYGQFGVELDIRTGGIRDSIRTIVDGDVNISGW